MVVSPQLSSSANSAATESVVSAYGKRMPRSRWLSWDTTSLGNGGAWDAFDAATARKGNGSDIGGIDWDAFANDDSLA